MSRFFRHFPSGAPSWTWVALFGVLAVSVAACSGNRNRAGSTGGDEPPTRFQSESFCGNCHVELVQQHSESMHARSFSNPVFRAHFYDHYLPEFHFSPTDFAKEPACLGCHAPLEAVDRYREAKVKSHTGTASTSSSRGECTQCHATTAQELPESTPGVTCDLCHRIEGIGGDRPENGNFVATPGEIKLGPLKYEGDHHRQYSELHGKSELCGICHSSVNRYGVRTRTTFEEWKSSSYAKKGIECQACHMSVHGFLIEGKAVHEKGRAVSMTLGRAPEREQIYTHRFVGAHSKTQIEGAIGLELSTWTSVVTGGDRLRITVRVQNDRSGHKTPTGSAELRIAWLDVDAVAGEDIIPVELGGNKKALGVTGETDTDLALFGEALPPGKRIYRAVFVDRSGQPTFLFYDAVKMIFDNRLEADEVRRETYYARIPNGLEGKMEITATLYYLRYPVAFAKRLGIEECEQVPIATAKKTITIR